MKPTHRILALDVGERTIGLAVSDPFGWTAQGLYTIKRVSKEKDLEQLMKLISEYQVSELLVGLPRNMNGTYGPQAEKVREFIEQIRTEVPCTITEWDERLSTKMAERSLIEADMSRAKRKKIIDTAAAACILQGYLDYHQIQQKNNQREEHDNGN